LQKPNHSTIEIHNRVVQSLKFSIVCTMEEWNSYGSSPSNWIVLKTENSGHVFIVDSIITEIERDKDRDSDPNKAHLELFASKGFQFKETFEEQISKKLC
jgi:hypothetical protein